MKIAAISSKSDISDQKYNFNNCCRWIERAWRRGALFIHFPELSLSGYTKDRDALSEIKHEVERNFIRLLDYSKNFPSIAVSLGLPIYEDDKIFIGHVTISNGNVIHTHRKKYLSPGEAETFSHGHKVDTGFFMGINFGVQVCFETHFPEMTALLENKGANLIVMPFASPGETPTTRKKRLMKFLPARAYDNTVFVSSCNNIILNKNIKSTALSFILDPKGNIIKLKKGYREKCVYGEISKSSINKLKNRKMSYFRRFSGQQ